ncbi:envelope glycoprotein [Trichinella britovi]|uniref:Envelope glycoprotein n=1 Tax=Trichinella britovi TaxID=45882 RepID=A0A0V0YXT6_TRIBR|nr:envelope glycoprotein [Trichinella britovi]
MILNQHLDLVEEQIGVLYQLAQLGCERKLGALYSSPCILQEIGLRGSMRLLRP